MNTKNWMSLAVVTALALGGCGDDDTDGVTCDNAADGTCPAGCPADPDCAGMDMMVDPGGFPAPPAALPEASLGEGADGMVAVTTSPADFSCMGTRTAPAGGDDKTFTLEVREFQTDDAFEGLCVQFFADNMVDLSAGCTPGTDLTTDASGNVSVTAPAGGWYAYRVFPMDGATASMTIADSIQINEQVPEGDTATANSISEGTLNLIPVVLGLTRADDTALVAGTFQDCNEDPVYGGIVRIYDSSGNPILEQGAATAPKYRYFNGENFPSADNQWSHVDGLFASANIPAPPAGGDVFVEVWGIMDGEFQIIGCERSPVLPNAISIVNVGPLRADGPTCPGME